MKKYLLLIIGVQASFFAGAQKIRTYATDAEQSRWVIDINAMGGYLMQDYTTQGPAITELPVQTINYTPGKMDFSNGYSLGGDVQVGFFWGKKRHFGIGTGFNYMYQSGSAGLKDYHIEYAAVDYNSNVYRPGNIQQLQDI